MIVFLALVLVVLAGLVVALVLGRWGGRGEAMVAPTSTSPFEPLPEGRLDADRAREVRFDIGLRGYRMDQVDTVLDRLVLELRSRDGGAGSVAVGRRGSDRTDRAPGQRRSTRPAGRRRRPGRPVDRAGLGRPRRGALRAMGVLTLERTTSATPEQVWQVVTDWSGYARWMPLTTMRLDHPGPPGWAGPSPGCPAWAGSGSPTSW